MRTTKKCETSAMNYINDNMGGGGICNENVKKVKANVKIGTFCFKFTIPPPHPTFISLHFWCWIFKAHHPSSKLATKWFFPLEAHFSHSLVDEFGHIRFSGTEWARLWPGQLSTCVLAGALKHFKCSSRTSESHDQSVTVYLCTRKVKVQLTKRKITVSQPAKAS